MLLANNSISPKTDQPFWSEVLKHHKLGPGAFPIGKLSAQRFRRLLKDALTPSKQLEEYRINTKTMMERIRGENGNEAFTKLILQCLHRHGCVVESVINTCVSCAPSLL